MSILGRGLESLIPKRDEAPEEPAALDVLDVQAQIAAPVYRFHDDARDRGEAAANAFIPAAAPGAPVALAEPRRQRDSVFSIDVSKIEPNPHQPRRVFGVDELTALADSIREHGVLQPLLVSKHDIEIAGGLDVRYELIAGERRWRAAKIAGLREVPVVIRVSALADRDKLELALVENIQREDLNPIERARAFEKLVGEFGLMQKDVAGRIGKSREVVANALRLLRLPSEMQEAMLANSITESHARVLLTLEHDPVAQRALFERIRAADLSVRDAEATARAAGAAPVSRRGRPRLDPDSRALERELEEAFGTKVKLLKRGDHGRIIVEFYSDEELRGILGRISKKEEGYV